jgi:LPS export ABC transporter permease LptG
MKILTRYILKEMLTPTVLGFVFYTFIILTKQLFDFAGLIIKSSLPGGTTFRLLILSLPHIVVLTVPMSLLFGILIAVGRLSTDSEIIAMRALGISTRTIYRPVFLFSFAVFLVSLYLMNVVLPRGNTELQALRLEITTSQIDKEIRPRVFYDEYENLMIYVNDVDPRSGTWKGVFIADSRGEDAPDPNATTPQQILDAANANASNVFVAQRSTQRIIVAQTGTISLFKKTRQIWLTLHNAETHLWDPRKAERYDQNRNVIQRMRLPEKMTAPESWTRARSLREMTLPELLVQAEASRNYDPEIHRLALVEVHKKFAFPFACVVFGIVGLPLGITNRRGGKSSGFSLSIGIIVFYYVLINNGEHLAGAGKISPAVGMWAPNVVLFVIGLYLLGRANREGGAQKAEGNWLRRLMDVLAAKRTPQRRMAEPGAPMAVKVGGAAAADDEHTILHRLDITFPNTLDRYILREFLKVLGLVLLSTAALFVVFDYTDLAGDVRRNNIAFHTIFAYYRFAIFQMFNFTVPISVLVSTLVTFGLFSKNNEVTAFKSSGVSLYRVALPVIIVGVVMSVLSYFMLDYILPYSNRRTDELRNKIKNNRIVAVANQQQKLWFLGHGRYIINFLAYDRNIKQLSQVQIFEFHPSDFRLTRRVYANWARWDGHGWEFRNGWLRSFSDDGKSTFTPITTPLRLYYSEKPQDFETEVKAPEQMTFQQLRQYIDTVKRSGSASEELSVKLYQKTSWPFLSLVMCLIALPFAFRVGKGGALYGVTIALVLGLLYWMIYAIFTKFGEVGNLPAALAAWSANILFAIGALYMFLKVET